MTLKPAICLTFDLEEFDLPLEYKQDISPKQQMAISTRGVEVLLPLLEKNKVSSTFFTTANYAQNNQPLMKQVCRQHEIASHSFYHSAYSPGDLERSKAKLEEICNTGIIGFRMPRMHDIDHAQLLSAGYLYDSSLNPTFLPGRYNHLREAKTIHRKNGLIIFPATVTPTLRIPLFWLTFKNFSVNWYCRQVEKCLRKYGYVNLYLHPWEFADLSAFKLPSWISKDHQKMKQKLELFLTRFENKARFISVKNLLHERKEL